jgi:hypothetical protein
MKVNYYITSFLGDNTNIEIESTFLQNKSLYRQSLRNKNFTKAYSYGAFEFNNLLNKNKPSISPKSNITYTTSNQPEISQMSPKMDPKNLMTAHMINNSNIIFQQILNMISEQDIKFQLIENNSQLESYIKSLDNTPVYYTFNN